MNENKFVSYNQLLVLLAGLEPASRIRRQILSLLCIPVPPQEQLDYQPATKLWDLGLSL